MKILFLALVLALAYSQVSLAGGEGGGGKPKQGAEGTGGLLGSEGVGGGPTKVYRLCKTQGENPLLVTVSGSDEVATLTALNFFWPLEMSQTENLTVKLINANELKTVMMLKSDSTQVEVFNVDSKNSLLRVRPTAQVLPDVYFWCQPKR